MPGPDILDLLTALGLGLLVGLQRESAKAQPAGLRTFALTTLLGAVAAQLIPAVGGWIVSAGFVGIAALAAVSHWSGTRPQGDAPGLTTEVALLSMFLVGAFVVAGDRNLAVVLGGGIAVLLQAKQRFRSYMDRLGDGDVRAIMQFALLSLVILPVLPDREFGPWGVLNLFEMWLLVVLIVGINLGGYIIYKFFGQNAGALVGGLLGGLISSTATTVSYSRRTREEVSAAPIAAVVIMIATAVVLVRVLIEIGVVAPALLRTATLPLGILFAFALILSIAIWWQVRNGDGEMPEQKNPTTLGPALTFAALYGVVLLAVAWAREWMGTGGLYLVAAIAGLTDVDAITLTTARMTQLGQLTGDQAWRVIMLAFISNLVFKAGIVGFMGARRLFWRIATLFALLGGAAGAMILAWPGG